MAFDRAHINTISRIFAAIAVEEMDTHRAILACEDAIVGLTLGLLSGMTPQAVTRAHTELIAEMDREGRLTPQSSPESPPTH